MRIVIKTMEGLEGVLEAELKSMNIFGTTILRRAVECEVNTSQLYKCNYMLRTALRVLVPIGEFDCEDEDSLYEAIRTLNWSNYLGPKMTFAIDATVAGDIFTHSQYVIYKAKDAIVDQIRDKSGDRPAIDTRNPSLRINLHISGTRVTVSLDSSGQSLHLRNYKYRTYKAPLNEVLAAGMILLTGWNGRQTFQDPMCGSGTLITEALSIAGNIPPGKFINSFGFEKWLDFQPEIWTQVKESADSGIRNPEVEIIASDVSRYAIRDVKKNLQKFPFREKVRLYERDFFRTHGASDRLLVMNPPYDIRVNIDDIDTFYKQIGDALKIFWKGSEAWIFSGNLEALKSVGLRPSKKLVLYNGGIESRFCKYELYEGSKKSKYSDKDRLDPPLRPRRKRL